MTSRNPWDPQREPCCGSHILGLSCCDPNDCGPCCENCPTCPTLAYRRGREGGYAEAETAAVYNLRENPMNGDGSNHAIRDVVKCIRLLKGSTPAYRDELLRRYRERISEKEQHWPSTRIDNKAFNPDLPKLTSPPIMSPEELRAKIAQGMGIPVVNTPSAALRITGP